MSNRLINELLHPLTADRLPNNDNYVIDFLLKSKNATTKINTYLLIKHYMDFCNITSELNSLESMYYNSITTGSRELNICINISRILYNFVNEYAFLYIKQYSDDDTLIFKTLSSLYFPLNITSQIINTVRESSKKQYYKHLNDEELSENILYTVKLATIHRCSLLRIFNTSDRESPDSLKTLKGNTIVFDRKLLNKQITPFHIQNRQPSSIKEPLKYIKSNTIADLIDNSNFNYNLWLLKDSNRIPKTFIQEAGLDKISFDLKKITKVINFLNSTKCAIDNWFFDKLVSSIDADYALLNINKEFASIKVQKLELGGVVQTHKHTNTIYIEQTDNSKIDEYIQYTLLKKKVQYIKHDFFYFRHCLDQRTRIYTNSWPINYQLNHIVRASLILPKKSTNIKIFRSFFKSANYTKYGSIAKFWTYNRILSTLLNRLAQLAHKVVQLDYLDLWPHCDKALEEVIWLESIIKSVSIFAPRSCVGLIPRIEWGLRYVESDQISRDFEEGLHTEKYLIDKNLILRKKHIYIYRNVMQGKLDDTWWIDASSSALQLIAVARGISNELLAKLLNLIDNDTEFKGIYDYVLHELKKLTTQLNSNYAVLVESWTVDFVKKLLMPSAYGKTKWACFLEMEDILSSNLFWTEMAVEEQQELKDFWYSHVFSILKDLGLDLLDHIKMCQQQTDTNKHTNSFFGIPIITYPTTSLDRNKLIKDIRHRKCIQKELVTKLFAREDFQKIEHNSYLQKLVNKQINSDMLSEEKLYLRHEKAIKLLNKKLKEDDKYTRRINIIIGGRRYQLRVQDRLRRRFNKIKKKNSNTPNHTHSLDAAILQMVEIDLKKYEIPGVYIHDSIGNPISLSPIAAYIYRLKILDIIEESLAGKRLPPYQNSKEYVFNIPEYYKKIINATTLIS